MQGNLPLSLELGDRWVTHWNLGATYIPHATGPDGSRADLSGVNYGASIVYLVSDHFNLLTEFVGGSNEVTGTAGRVERQYWFLINPGMRFAIDFESGLQIVPGLSFPIGVGPSAGEYGVFLYLSFEHPLFKPKGRHVEAIGGDPVRWLQARQNALGSDNGKRRQTCVSRGVRDVRSPDGETSAGGVTESVRRAPRPLE